MRRFLEPLLTGIFTCCLTTLAFAHAFLDHASPAVGSSVQGSPSELALTFTQNIVAGFSGVSLRAEGGGSVPLGKPAISGNTLDARIGHALKPGTYVVSWHVVSVDTHHTQGSFKFTVTP